MEYPKKDLTEKIIGAAIEVHKYWGPVLIESVYEKSHGTPPASRITRHARQQIVTLIIEADGDIRRTHVCFVCLAESGGIRIIHGYKIDIQPLLGNCILHPHRPEHAMD